MSKNLIDYQDEWDVLCSRAQDLSDFTENERIWYFAQCLIDAVENGGLVSFFYNNTADYYAETVDALEKLSAEEIKEILFTIADLFPKKVSELNLAQRNEIINEWENEKHTLEGDIEAHSKEMEHWLELSERTYNFARYASTWFTNGDIETKRAIFACLGSNLILKDQNINVELRKPFQFIFENLPEAERELVQVRTSENPLYKGQNVSFNPELIKMRALWEEVRTFFATNKML